MARHGRGSAGRILAAGLLADLGARRVQLQQLRALLLDSEERLCGALSADFGKPPIETYATEIGFTIKEIDEALKSLEYVGQAAQGEGADRAPTGERRGSCPSRSASC